MIDAIAISVIICTRNRAGRLAACLASVARLRCTLPWEVIVVDNGSSDQTPAVIDAFLTDYPALCASGRYLL